MATGRIEDFDKILAEELEQNKPFTSEEKKSRRRIQRRIRYWQQKTDTMADKNSEATAATAGTAKRAPVDLFSKFDEHVAKRAKQYENDKESEDRILELLRKQGDRIDAFQQEHNKHLETHGDRIDAFQQAHNKRMETQRREHEEDHIVFLELAKGTGYKEPTPAVVPTVYDTPMRPTRSVTPNDFMSTPSRRQLSQAWQPKATPRRIDMGTIDEEKESGAKEESVRYALLTCKDDEGGSSLFRGSFIAGAIDGMAQVLDCTVTLQRGKIVPIKYIDMGLQMTDDSDSLVAFDTEPIQFISSHGSYLLGKAKFGNTFTFGTTFLIPECLSERPSSVWTWKEIHMP
eukprot:scaffold1695_cov167-Amphora_coffeaeformis.AAC.4